MAYTEKVDNNSEDSHQTSPAYVLTVVRWSNRDSLNYKSTDAFETRRPLVIVSDAVSIQVSYSKGNPNHSFSCLLKQGDLNYLTAIHPGDYITVNMVNSHEKAMQIRGKALGGKPINHYNDGFKGLFKINDVRMKLTVTGNGSKNYFVNVSGRAFDEFNNNLYFNPAFNNKQDSKNFLKNNFENFREVIKNKEKSNVQNLVKEVIKRTIGVGIKVLNGDYKLNQQPEFKVPGLLVSLLNKKGKKKDKNDQNDQNDPFISKINNYYMGIWNSSTSKSKNPADGFNSFFEKWKNEGSNWYKTKSELPGTRQISFENFSNIKTWSLMQDYSNPVLNEMYTCFRIAKDGYVYPSLIVRQKPFNNRAFKDKNKVKHTQFLDVPRWKISPYLIYDLEIGRSDSARINFVLINTTSIAVNANLNAALQITAPNYILDKDDIERHGRKPFVANCNYDFPKAFNTKEKVQQQIREWASLVSDWVQNGHLKLNGTITSAGIVKPICIGDNLEFDGVVYHIESINHAMQLDDKGGMMFRTRTSLSMGISDNSSDKIPVYGEMDYTDAFTRRKDDYKNERVLPGFSDTQDLPGRLDGEEVSETKEKSFTNPKSKNKGKKK